MESENTNHLVIPISRLRRFEKELRTRVNVRFTIQNDVYIDSLLFRFYRLESIETFLSNELDRFYRVKRENVQNHSLDSTFTLSASDIESMTLFSKQMPGFSNVYSHFRLNPN